MPQWYRLLSLAAAAFAPRVVVIATAAAVISPRATAAAIAEAGAGVGARAGTTGGTTGGTTSGTAVIVAATAGVTPAVRSEMSTTGMMGTTDTTISVARALVFVQPTKTM